MNKTILDIGIAELLETFLDQYCKQGDIYRETAKEVIKQTISYYRKGESGVYTRKLEKRWYDSLKMQAPDFSIYDDDYYLMDLWACWVIYSREYLNMIHARDVFAEDWEPYHKPNCQCEEH